MTIPTQPILSDDGKPYFSKVLTVARPFDAKEPRTEFGKKWKELVAPISAIRVKTNLKMISSIKNIIHEDVPLLTQLGHLSIGDRTSIFQLLDGEYLTKVQVYTGDNSMNAIRFHTNKRVSPWFGSAAAAGSRDLQITAPEGFYIHSLCGAWGHGLRELGAVFYPLGRQSEQQPSPQPVMHLLDPLVHRPEKDGDDGFHLPFTTTNSGDIGAIIINADPQIKWVWVLSRRQLSDLLSLVDGIFPGENEHWIDLVEEEQVLGADVVHDSSVMIAMRVKTTHRETPWIGQPKLDLLDTKKKTPMASFECKPTERFCGFYGARGRQGVVLFGVVAAGKKSGGDEDVAIASESEGTDEHDETKAEELAFFWDLVESEDEECTCNSE